MMFTAHYQSPLGEILLAADEVGLTGLWFDRAKYYAAGLAPQSTERETPPLTEAKRWLDVYFSGKMPDFMPPLMALFLRQEPHVRLDTREFYQDDPLPMDVPLFISRCGRCCCKFHTGKRQHTARWPPGLRQSMARRTCPPRRWAEPWDITPFRSSSRATVWWVPAAA